MSGKNVYLGLSEKGVGSIIRLYNEICMRTSCWQQPPPSRCPVSSEPTWAQLTRAWAWAPWAGAVPAPRLCLASRDPRSRGLPADARGGPGAGPRGCSAPPRRRWPFLTASRRSLLAAKNLQALGSICRGLRGLRVAPDVASPPIVWGRGWAQVEPAGAGLLRGLLCEPGPSVTGR